MDSEKESADSMTSHEDTGSIQEFFVDDTLDDESNAQKQSEDDTLLFDTPITDDDLARLASESAQMLEVGVAAFEMSWRWADFHIYVISPTIPAIDPPRVIQPAKVEEDESLEHVYPIMDSGYCLSTSRGKDLLSSGKSMCQLYYTIEKMVAILVERIKEQGISTDTEVKVAFSGFEFAQRKGFESIINLDYNVVVTNFDPGEWGEGYLATVKRLADAGFGYPSEAPRDTYRHAHAHTPSRPKR